MSDYVPTIKKGKGACSETLTPGVGSKTAQTPTARLQSRITSADTKRASFERMGKGRKSKQLSMLATTQAEKTTQYFRKNAGSVLGGTTLQ